MSVRMGSALRIVTFAIRGRTMYPPEVGLHAEDLVLQQSKEQVQAAQTAAHARLDTLGLVDSGTTVEIAVGSRWDEAMDDIDWEPAEVLVVGSSRAGRLARVFLARRRSTPRSGCPGSPPQPESSASPTSGWTPCPRRVKT